MKTYLSIEIFHGLFSSIFNLKVILKHPLYLLVQKDISRIYPGSTTVTVKL